MVLWEISMIAVKLIAALYAPIPDCDEIYNYWEPMSFLIHGYGKETWEYSPEFGLRSWLYILYHSAPAYVINSIIESKVIQFYVMRFVLGLVSAFTQMYMVKTMKGLFTEREVCITKIWLLWSTGIFLSGNTFLPNTFSMNALTLAMSFWFQWNQHGNSGILPSVLWIANSVVLGWPFVGLVPVFWVLPLIPKHFGVILSPRLYMYAIIAAVLTILPSILADSAYYGKPAFAILNLIFYNTSIGSNMVGQSVLYGTEPWTFYFANLGLNFNLMFVWMLLYPIYLILTYKSKETVNQVKLSLAFAIVGWFAFMTSQPHKEERFMYVIYVLLVVSSSCVVAAFPRRIAQLTLLVFILLSTMRTVQVVRSYNAPLDIWNDVSGQVWVGKEWYRYPSSYFLPNSSRLSFYADGFEGQLPVDFQDTSKIPPYLNSMNREQPEIYIDIQKCDYIVDLDLASSPMRKFEGFSVVKSRSFLDSGMTPQPFRSLYIPFAGEKEKWGTYVLLKKNN